jgi:hypothetical protein
MTSLRAGVLPAFRGRVPGRRPVFALVEKNKVVSAWTAPASGEFTQLPSAADSTFTSGHPAVEASGNNTRISNFRAGQLPAF